MYAAIVAMYDVTVGDRNMEPIIRHQRGRL
jgi:hypothetical protein